MLIATKMAECGNTRREGDLSCGCKCYTIAGHHCNLADELDLVLPGHGLISLTIHSTWFMFSVTVDLSIAAHVKDDAIYLVGHNTPPSVS